MNKRDTYLPFGRPNFTEEEIDAVARVMRSGWIGMGPETIAFEQELARAMGAPQVITVSSCTAAMSLALRVLDLGPGDEVICPTLTWCSTANAALYHGAKPVFCDLDPETLGMTPETVHAVLTERTKAVMLVHYGGLALDPAAFRAVLPDSVAIVEDAAHALGARYPDGRPVGASGNLVCFSFYANKNLATAEGGAIALSDAALADRLRSLRQHGLPVDAWQRFTHANSVLLSPQLTELGYKANYTDFQAALGRVQLRRFPEMAARRAEIARLYLRELIADSALHLRAQAGLDSDRHARHLFVVRVGARARRNRDAVLCELRARNIGATIHYGLLHRMPLYAQAGRRALPGADAIAPEILTLPISASMTVADADEVVGHLRELLG